jgi:hypothetical protein
MIGQAGEFYGRKAGLLRSFRSSRCSVQKARCAFRAVSGVVVLLSLLSLFATPCRTQVQDENAVRAAFVFNLTKYIEWPRTGNEVVIGVVGGGSIGEALQKTLAGKTVESRPIRVVLSPADDELPHCQLLYLTHTSSKTLRAALDKVRSKDILTVGDTDSFAREGGMIGLVRADEQIQIQVNLEVAEESQLKISSRLLNLATLVKSAPGARN